MTTLYRPVPITNLGQANALPRGSVVFDGDPEDGQTYYRSGDDWYVDGHPGLMSIAVECGTPVTALVPIEAEEEQVAVAKASDGTETCYNPDAASHPVFGGYIGSLPIRTRLVTPWEEA